MMKKGMTAPAVKVTRIFSSTTGTLCELPLYLTRVAAGFPSPADDYLERKLDLNEHLIAHPAASFFVRVEGESMKEAGICSGDMLIVDRSLEVKNNAIVVAVINGEFTVKRMARQNGKLYLQPENDEYRATEITEDNDFEIWGVVRHVIRSFV